jgi:hypothetical protein
LRDPACGLHQGTNAFRHGYGWSELFALRDDRLKLVRAPRPELFDVARDPGESNDLAADARERVASLDAALGALLARHGGDQAKAPSALDAETLERLRALGYLGAGSASHAADQRARADPKDKIHLYNRIKDSLGQSRAGWLDGARKTLSQVLAEDTEIAQAHLLLGSLEARRPPSRRGTGVPGSSRAGRRQHLRGLQPRPGIQGPGPARRGGGRIRARAGARSTRRQAPLAPGRHLDAPRRVRARKVHS